MKLIFILLISSLSHFSYASGDRTHCNTGIVTYSYVNHSTDSNEFPFLYEEVNDNDLSITSKTYKYYFLQKRVSFFKKQINV